MVVRQNGNIRVQRGDVRLVRKRRQNFMLGRPNAIAQNLQRLIGVTREDDVIKFNVSGSRYCFEPPEITRH